MQVKCGIDMIEIDRIKEAIETTNKEFINRVYTKREIEYCESKNNMKYQHYAARFAAKEAAFKAISEEFGKYEITWKDIEITSNEVGRPQVAILNKNIPNLESIDISISHCKNYAIANVTILVV